MNIRDDAGAWVDEEFETLDLGDPRRDRRAKELVKRHSGRVRRLAETMAAYRFLGNERIDWRDIMQPHWDRTTARMGALPVVLCIADTLRVRWLGPSQQKTLTPIQVAALLTMPGNPSLTWVMDSLAAAAEAGRLDADSYIAQLFASKEDADLPPDSARRWRRPVGT